MQGEEGVQEAEEEGEGARSPTELLRKLIFYAQFHDTPEQSGLGPQGGWDFGAPEGDFQVEAQQSSNACLSQSKSSGRTKLLQRHAPHAGSASLHRYLQDSPGQALTCCAQNVLGTGGPDCRSKHAWLGKLHARQERLHA